MNSPTEISIEFPDDVKSNFEYGKIVRQRYAKALSELTFINPGLLDLKDQLNRDADEFAKRCASHFLQVNYRDNKEKQYRMYNDTYKMFKDFLEQAVDAVLSKPRNLRLHDNEGKK